jgi:threonine dehydrogenase-like Zn-dependent dehydrogenase
MRAVCWNGRQDVRVETVPDPKILNPRDAIIKVTSTAICGSDLHLYDGYIPTMMAGDVLGHEFMGEVVELGSAVNNLAKGDRVVVPFTIACGNCFFCKKQMFGICDNSNPNNHILEKAYGFGASGIFGYSHMLGGYAGGQAEYVRVPYADVGPIKIPDGLADEKVLFLTDIFPTAYMAVENCNVQPGDTIAIWGAGPVGQFAVKSAFLLGASKVISIDDVPERLRLAEQSGAVAIDMSDTKVFDKLLEHTGGRGPDGCVDCVGMEAHGATLDAVVDKVKAAMFLATDRPHALRQAIDCCRKGGTVSAPGVYGGFLDKFPFGAAFNKGLTFKMGQTHMQKYLRPLLERVQRNEIDLSFLITHRGQLDDAPGFYRTFHDHADHCIKCVMKP